MRTVKEFFILGAALASVALLALFFVPIPLYKGPISICDSASVAVPAVLENYSSVNSISSDTAVLTIELFGSAKACIRFKKGLIRATFVPTEPCSSFAAVRLYPPILSRPALHLQAALARREKQRMIDCKRIAQELHHQAAH